MTATDERQPETVLATHRSMLRWHGPKMGFTVFGTVLGAVVVTSERLLFVTDGSKGLTGQFKALGEHLSSIVPGETPARDVDLSLLSNEHSLSIPLHQLREARGVRRWDLARYLRVECTQDGVERSFAFGTKTGLNHAALEALVRWIDRARGVVDA